MKRRKEEDEEIIYLEDEIEDELRYLEAEDELVYLKEEDKEDELMYLKEEDKEEDELMYLETKDKEEKTTFLKEDKAIHVYRDLLSKLNLLCIDSPSVAVEAVMSSRLSPVFTDVCAKGRHSAPVYQDQKTAELPFSSFEHDSGTLFEGIVLFFFFKQNKNNLVTLVHGCDGVQIPPCSNGEKCLGIMGNIVSMHTELDGDLFRGRILQAYYLPGQRPRDARGKCLLCIRCDIIRVVSVFTAQQADQFDPKMRLQSFFNSNEMGEYIDGVLLFPNNALFNGLIAPIAQYNQSLLIWKFDKTKGLFYVDQGAYKKTAQIVDIDASQKRGKK